MHKFSIGFLLIVTAVLGGCTDQSIDEAELQARLIQLTTRALDNQVFIEGATFTMGDFGAEGEDGVWRPYFPPTIEEDRPHEVTLSSYSLSRHKTTWEDFDTFLLAENRPVIARGLSKSWDRPVHDADPESHYYISKPAQVTWQEAKDYCLWLATLTELPFDLPTSAQWEFAARNRGSTAWVFSTHDGKAPQMNWERYERTYQGREIVPVGSRLPPNPLGLYDMADNGHEWVNDWFSETWYRENPSVTDPEGPPKGTRKTIRNLEFSFSRAGRSESIPSLLNEEWNSVAEFTFRCALQRPTPLTDAGSNHAD